MSWSAKITKVDNGFEVTYMDYSEDLEHEIRQTKVFQVNETDSLIEDEDFIERQCLVQALYFLCEYFALGYSKWDKHNIQITTGLRGHKVYDEKQ